jgi:hypothetical protein
MSNSPFYKTGISTSPLKCTKPPCPDLSKVAKKLKLKKINVQDTLKLPTPKENENRSDYLSRTTGDPGFVRSNKTYIKGKWTTNK